LLLSRSELEDLTQTYDQWHVSIYMPTYRAGDEIRQNAIRFKNLLDRAEEQLVEVRMRRPEAQEGIAKQPNRLSAEELHREAWPIVRSTFSQAQERAEETYHHLSGTESERVSHDIEEVVRAAAFGRVEGLLVARDEQRWGAFDEETGAVELHGEQQPGDQDLLDVAAVQTMLHEGWLFVVDGEDVPPADGQGGPGAREHSLAAVLRW
jgi:hypothetical protein